MGQKNPSFVFFKWLTFIFSPLILHIHLWISKLHRLTQSQTSLVVKNSPTNAGEMSRRFDPCVGEFHWRRKWQHTPWVGIFHAWKISRTEEPHWLPSMGLQRIRHDWVRGHTCTHTHTHTHPVCLLCTTDSESKRVLMRVEGTSCDENTDFCCPKHLLQLLTRRFFVFILLTSSFFSITIVMLITLKNRRLKDLFFILFTASAYVFHEISPFWQDPIAKTPDWKRQVPVQ